MARSKSGESRRRTQIRQRRKRRVKRIKARIKALKQAGESA